MNMKYYLYTFEDNWADEMDLEGFMVLTELQKDSVMTKIKRKFKRGGSICFGTNEDNEYDTLQDVLNCITVKEITQAEYSTLKKLFGDSFGETGPANSYDYDFDDEDDIEDDDEDDDDFDEEKEYVVHAKIVHEFIKSEYGLEATSGSNCFSEFKWRPTTKTEILITIGEYVGGEEEIEISLKLNGKDVGYESFEIFDIYDDPKKHLKGTITQFIEKAKKY